MNYGRDEREMNRRSSMRKIGMKTLLAVMATLAMFAFVGCSKINEEDAPVLMIATIVDQVQVYDLLSPPPSLGVIELRAIVKRTDVSSVRFLDVQLRSYRVTYQRTDGGKMVPQGFVRTTSGLIEAGGTATELNSFLAFEVGAFQQAPFAALLPQNGGVDPETGQRKVNLDIIIDIYGETLSGENVSARARMPLTFCAGCAG